MYYRYHIDSDTGLPHILGHGITEEEVEWVLGSRNTERRRGDNDSIIAIGQTMGGRVLKVIYSPDPEPGSVFVITAYQISGKPLRAHNRRLRKK